MEQLKEKGLTLHLATKFSDFIAALKSSKPSVSSSDLGRYIDFTKTFGMDGWYVNRFIGSLFKKGIKILYLMSFYKISSI